MRSANDCEAPLQQFARETIDQGDWDWLAQRMQYLSGDLDNASTYQRLKALLREIDGKAGTGGNYLFYFAIPASEFAGVVGQLGAAGLVRENSGLLAQGRYRKTLRHRSAVGQET